MDHAWTESLHTHYSYCIERTMHMRHAFLFLYYLHACLHKTYSANAELSVLKGLTETGTEGPL